MNLNELTQLFALANEFKEGDLLVGGTRDEQVRNEAREALASVRLGEIAKGPFVEGQVSDSVKPPRCASGNLGWTQSERTQ